MYKTFPRNLHIAEHRTRTNPFRNARRERHEHRTFYTNYMSQSKTVVKMVLKVTVQQKKTASSDSSWTLFVLFSIRLVLFPLPLREWERECVCDWKDNVWMIYICESRERERENDEIVPNTDILDWFLVLFTLSSPRSSPNGFLRLKRNPPLNWVLLLLPLLNEWSIFSFSLCYRIEKLTNKVGAAWNFENRFWISGSERNPDGIQSCNSFFYAISCKIESFGLKTSAWYLYPKFLYKNEPYIIPNNFQSSE